MAVAWSKDEARPRSTATSSSVTRSALTASAPRFLTLGDEARLDLSLHNVDGPARRLAVAFHDGVTNPEPPVRNAGISPSARCRPKGRRAQSRANFDEARPTSACWTSTCSVTGPEGIGVKRHLTRSTSSPRPATSSAPPSACFPPKAASSRFDRICWPDLIPSRTQHQLLRGPAAPLDVPGAADPARPLSLWLRRADGAAPCRWSTPMPSRLRSGIGTDKGSGGPRAGGGRARVRDARSSSGAFGTGDRAIRTSG